MSASETTPQSNHGIGILGGSFDPVHVGHLWMAESALEQLPIEHVRWIPAATSPLKPHGPVASNEHRLQMLRLALSGQSGLVIDDWELRQDSVSYTLLTLEYLQEQFPDRPLYLIIGADSLASFDRWREPEQILKRCHLAVIARGGDPPPDYSILDGMTDETQIQRIRESQIQMPQIEISSSDLRNRIATGRSIRFRVPHPVATLIDNEKMYRVR
ncbi:probable nicotinate-nucleotide adenylyltransferase [Rhodopirellula baltica SH 1]|uniref:Probable nicotinate-nucleotide adenylyltransferase n=1 Tax=Rhodopirellula baltica (strain DSM 10527 / NCIMB 13988 / SH1) TaxID=243090 RepID=NADD_RHOBA|nr:RecName: Full=Probable nicotinate-nucleotide adenylyltransferase; AltName: Full=Deamido-NAD(+) diphosphorylase; AltName: Full=Deamido-NAD(+) pyrophosphorylase; AltName: Full=Nicotinate mononucleotide adenylyltransferase; Short=NaMN adenylyltransferase [Rhodopirellula baltica SH 1]CAD78646.1 probable nicotinate-nucleotide adenylyltransferase [Rhodopirellula baltica SH 1]